MASSSATLRAVEVPSPPAVPLEGAVPPPALRCLGDESSITERPKGVQSWACTICLDTEGEVIQQGCCCRGDAGAAHVACLIELAAHAADTRKDWNSWSRCNTCLDYFTGTMQNALAEAWFARVVERDSEDEERSHATTCLADSLYGQGRYAEAARYEAEVLEIDKRLYGEEHGNYLTAACNLATSYKAMGDYIKAAELQLSVLEARTRLHGQDHPDTLYCASSLAVIYDHQSKYTEAEEILVRVWHKCKELLGEESQQTMQCGVDLAATLTAQG